MAVSFEESFVRKRINLFSVGTVIQYIRYILFILAVTLFLCGYLSGRFNVILCGVLSLFLSNVFFGFADGKNRVIFLFFHLTIFTFLLSRPTISMLRGDCWWYFDFSAVCFALNALFLTLLFLRLGVMVGDEILKKHRSSQKVSSSVKKPLYEYDFRRSMQVVSFVFFIITMGVYLLLQLEKLQFMQGREYAEIYLSFQSAYPAPVQTLGSMMKYALCIFLATLPSKRMAFLPLALYFLSAVPSLLIGMRNPIVLNAIFIFIYYFFRDVLGDEERWLGTGEKLFLIIAVPLALCFLGAYNYMRDGVASSLGVVGTLIDFFYKQGVSFDVLCMGYSAIPDLPDVISKIYTLGPFENYFYYGPVGRFLFHTTPLGSQNSELVAVYGYSFAHSMSYVAHPGYLSGHGWGSSYLLESFADGGYWGVVFVSFLFGLSFQLSMLALRKNILWRTILFVSLLNLFFVPRAETTGWLLFIVTVQFWLSIIFCYFLSGLCSRRYSHQNADGLITPEER